MKLINEYMKTGKTFPTLLVVRSEANYEGKFDRFVLKGKDYSKQYNGVYLARLFEMRTSLRYLNVNKPCCVSAHNF